MSMFVLKRGALVIGVLAAVYAGLAATQRADSDSKAEQPAPPPQPEKQEPTKNPEPGRKVVFETTKGKITAVLYEKDAPITTKNFVELVERKFYDGLIFHRVEPDFVAQTGDPEGTGRGGSGKTIPLEILPNLRHDAPGVLGMARTNDPNSATSQFYFTLKATPFLDNNYAVFGKVVEGMDVVKNIKINDKMTKVYLVEPAKPTGDKAEEKS